MAKSICEEQHFKEVFYDCSEELRNFMYYKCGNLEQAEDLVQEAFGKLWQNCAKIIYESARSFLYKVANNLFLNQVAHNKVRLRFVQKNQDVQTSHSPEFLYQEKEFKEKLMAAISDLPEGQRVVFLMNRIDKKTYKEIAKSLDIGVKAVEKRMHLALKQLRKIHKNV